MHIWWGMKSQANSTSSNSWLSKCVLLCSRLDLKLSSLPVYFDYSRQRCSLQAAISGKARSAILTGFPGVLGQSITANPTTSRR